MQVHYVKCGIPPFTIHINTLTANDCIKCTNYASMEKIK